MWKICSFLHFKNIMGKKRVPLTIFTCSVGDPGWNLPDLTGSAFISELQCVESCPLGTLEDLHKWVLKIKKKKTFNRAVISFDKVINDCFRWRNYSKKTYTDAEGRTLQKVRMFLYKSTGTFIWQGWNTLVQIQTLCWLKEQVYSLLYQTSLPIHNFSPACSSYHPLIFS